MLSFALIGSREMSYPQIVMLPSSNGMMPVMHFIVVLFPAPFFPFKKIIPVDFIFLKF